MLLLLLHSRRPESWITWETRPFFLALPVYVWVWKISIDMNEMIMLSILWVWFKTGDHYRWYNKSQELWSHTDHPSCVMCVGGVCVSDLHKILKGYWSPSYPNNMCLIHFNKRQCDLMKNIIRRVLCRSCLKKADLGQSGLFGCCSPTRCLSMRRKESNFARCNYDDILHLASCLRCPLHESLITGGCLCFIVWSLHSRRNLTAKSSLVCGCELQETIYYDDDDEMSREMLCLFF